MCLVTLLTVKMSGFVLCCVRALVEEKWGKAIRAFQAADALDPKDEADLEPGKRFAINSHEIE